MWPLLIIAGAEVAILASIYLVTARYVPPPRLVAHDAIALPGAELNLQLHLEQDLPTYLKGPLAGVEIEVTPPAGAKGGEALTGGRCRTGGNGSAELVLKAPVEPGIHKYHAQVLAEHDETEERPAAAFLIHVIPRDAKLVITTLRDTLWEASAEKGSGRLPAPRKHASQALAEIAQSHAVVYLNFHWRSDPQSVRRWLRDLEFPIWASTVHPERIERWLEEYSFPEGAQLVPHALTRPGGRQRWQAVQEHLKKELTSRWKNIVWGFSTSSEAMMAFQAASIPPVRIGASSSSPADGPGARAAVDWDAARKLVLGE